MQSKMIKVLIDYIPTAQQTADTPTNPRKILSHTANMKLGVYNPIA